MKHSINMLRAHKFIFSFLFLAVVGSMAAYFLIVGYSSPSSPADGTLSITVKFKGTPPSAPALKSSKAKSLCGMENIPNEALIIGKSNEIKNAMLYLKGAKGAVQHKDFALVNKECAFHPHVGFAEVNSKLILSNEDAVLHNTHGFYVLGKMRKTVLNDALPKGTKPITDERVFSKTGLIEFQCDAHEWMSGKVIVVDNPYHAITNEKGTAEITHVPPGEYDMVIYHETLGEQTKKVKVTAGQTEKVEVEFQ